MVTRGAEPFGRALTLEYVPQMQVQLPPALEALVRQKVASGLYRDELEVVSEALRLLDRADSADSAWDAVDWVKLEQAIQEGEADLAAGRYVDINSAEELRALMSGK